MEKNLTTGSVFKNVVLFSLPYLLSYFLQTLYGMADLFIIGQFEGVASTTAVSIGSQTVHLYAPQTTRKSTLIHRILSQKIRKCIWPRFILRLKMSTNRSKKLSCIITRILLGCQHNGNNTVRIPLGEC